MGLDVEQPAPPELEPNLDPDDYEDAEVQGDDYRREELENLMADGAWADAFREWSDGAEMDEADWQVVLDLEMLSHFDFFWDDFADRVGYHAPGIPEDWKTRDLHPDLDSW